MRPKLWTLLIHLLSWLAPSDRRRVWLVQWIRNMQSLWILVERGEPVGADAPLQLCRAAVADALGQRFSKPALDRWMRGPGFVMASSGAVLALLAVLSGGFAKTRYVIATARDLALHPWVTYHYDRRGDVVFAYSAPIVLALATGIVLIAISRPSAKGGWGYWGFLASKAIAAVVILPLMWIEGGAAVRAWIPNGTLRGMIGGVGMAFLFVAVFGRAALWIVTDQRQRCPICLRRLALPVTIGSWASVFDPATTEMLCEEGHGSLCVAETATAQEDRWITFDTEEENCRV